MSSGGQVQAIHAARMMRANSPGRNQALEEVPLRALGEHEVLVSVTFCLFRPRTPMRKPHRCCTWVSSGTELIGRLARARASDSKTPPAELDAGIIFAPVGSLVSTALGAVRKGGRGVAVLIPNA